MCGARYCAGLCAVWASSGVAGSRRCVLRYRRSRHFRGRSLRDQYWYAIYAPHGRRQWGAAELRSQLRRDRHSTASFSRWACLRSPVAQWRAIRFGRYRARREVPLYRCRRGGVAARHRCRAGDRFAGRRRAARSRHRPHPCFPALTIGRTFGAWNAVTEIGYAINPGSGNRDWWFEGGALTRDFGEALRLGAELFYTSAAQTGGKSNTAFSSGGIYNLSEVHHSLFAAGRSLQDTAENNQLAMYLAYRLTF
jgi:hypothetical protein